MGVQADRYERFPGRTRCSRRTSPPGWSTGVTAKQREDHAHYLKSWIAVLKADSRVIFSAVSQA